MRAAFAIPLLLAACDPIWGAHVDLRDPSNRPIENATIAVACSDNGFALRSEHMSVRSQPDGHAYVGGMGSVFPVGCDLFVAKPGYRTHRIRYREICPNGPSHCDRVFHFDLALEPE